MSTQTQWKITGDYFENCNCSVVCPCLFSSGAPLTSSPTQGFCDLAIAFHIDEGRHGEVSLDGLNVAIVSHNTGPMGQGNWTIAVYIDQRANDGQTEALGAIFGGAAGGPMAILAPLIGKNLGAKKVPVTYQIKDKSRSVEIPNIMKTSVHPLPSMKEGAEIWTSAAHPFNLDKLALAVGDQGNSYRDHGMSWNNSGKNGHYAPISWSNH
jgi:hypothetical protein